MTALPRRDQLHTADQAAAVLEVPAATIRRWHRAQQVMAAGMLRSRGRGGVQPMFQLEELQPLADRYHAKKGRHAASAQRR